MPEGFLAVFSSPGTQVTLDEFHDWYNNEHIPLRVNHLRSFLSGARFASTDSTQPSWLALYEIDDVSSFSDPSYTILREKRSAREAGLIQRLGVLDRRTCEVVYDSGLVVEGVGRGGTTGLNVGDPTRGVVTLDFAGEMSEEGFTSWVSELKKDEGWRRAKVVKVLDKGVSGVDGTLTSVDVPEFLAVLEYASKADVARVKAGLEGVVKIGCVREWELYRAYPCVGRPEFKEV